EQKGRSTTGQAPAENRNSMEKSGQNPSTEKGRTGQSNSMENRGATENNKMAPQNQGAAQNRAGGSSTTNVNVNLTTEQRTKIHSVIIADRSAPRVEHVNFALNVGVVVPRGTVKFAPVPATIVEIQPVWRGFEYFLVGDEIVIVDPADLHIVAVIPA